MPSPESIEHFKRLHETPPFGETGFDLEGLRSGMGSRRAPDQTDVKCIKVDVDGIPSEWVVAEDSDPQLRVMYLHGGGFVSGSGAYYLTLGAHIARAAKCAVLLPDYRLAPEYPFPVGLEDCIRVFEWMQTHGPDADSNATSTFISGDSAGGGLTLSALLALRDRSLPLPCGGIAISPFADLTLEGDSIRSEEGIDPIMHPRCLPDFTTRYLNGADPRDPLVSPAFGDYAGVPPILIQVGEHEIIRDDSVKAAESARSAGVDVTLEIWEGLFHVFQSHEPLLPEARDALEHIGEFVRTHSNT